MKLVIDEKLKHRLVGVSVILSLGAIFLPAMMKKSSQRLEHNFSVNVELPPKPGVPKVAVIDEEQMFKTIKVAKVDIQPAAKEQRDKDLEKEDFIASAPISVNQDPVMPVAKIEPASKIELVDEPIAKPLELALNDAAKNAVKKQITVAANKPVKIAKVAVKAVKVKVAPKIALAKVKKTPAIKKGIYAVQLASFAKLSNAQALVSKLKGMGHKANYTRIEGKNGVMYKVFVGHSPVKNNVVKLKTQLASAMQLNGMVVNTGVS